MSDVENMSLDDIIKQNRSNNPRRGRSRYTRLRGSNRERDYGIGYMPPQTTGGARDRRPRGGHIQTRSVSRGRSHSPSHSRSRSRSQTRSHSRSRSRSQTRSHSRSRSRSQTRGPPQSRSGSASRSRSRNRSLTRSRRARIEEVDQTNFYNRRFRRNRIFYNNSNTNVATGGRGRLGVTPSRGGPNTVSNRSMTFRRGSINRGQSISIGNNYRNLGLRSGQIIEEQSQDIEGSNENFITARDYFRSPLRLTISFDNITVEKRGQNTYGRGGMVQFSDHKPESEPGSVRSCSNCSSCSNDSNNTQELNLLMTCATNSVCTGCEIVEKCPNKQILNEQLQKEIAMLQNLRKNSDETESTSVIDYTPVPVTTNKTLHQRFS